MVNGVGCHGHETATFQNSTGVTGAMSSVGDEHVDASVRKRGTWHPGNATPTHQPDKRWLTPVLFLLAGAGYPLLWLRDKVKARHRAISRALPYDMDLLTLAVEAGLDFAAALGKVVAMGRKGALAEELAITLKELKLGKTREEALRSLSHRPMIASLTVSL